MKRQIVMGFAALAVAFSAAPIAQGDARSEPPRPCQAQCPKLGIWRGQEDEGKRRPISFRLAVVDGAVRVTDIELPGVEEEVPDAPLKIERASEGGNQEVEYRFDLAFICARCESRPVVVDVHGRFDGGEIDSMGGSWSDSGFSAEWIRREAKPDPPDLRPKPGWYEGKDALGYTVRFRLAGSEILNMRIADHAYAPTNLRRGGQGWQSTCNATYCSRGEWTSNTEVEGFRSTTYAPAETAFEARWVEAPGGR